MIALAMLMAGQAASAPSPKPSPPPTRWSVLSPSEKCLSQPADERDIVVCARLRSEQRLPLPDEREPQNRPRQASGEPRAAFENSGEPCLIHGCLVGFGPPIMPLLKGAAVAIKNAFAKRPDKTGRIAIPLDDPLTSKITSGKIMP